jgi:hypothetical protein
MGFFSPLVEDETGQAHRNSDKPEGVLQTAAQSSSAETERTEAIPQVTPEPVYAGGWPLVPKADRDLRCKRDFRNHANRDDSREHGKTLLQKGSAQMPGDESTTKHAK